MVSESVKHPALKDVKSSFEGLSGAIVAHSKWLAEWNKRIICTALAEDKNALVESHQDCCFGKWYYGEQPTFLRQKQEFIDIEKCHEAVHEQMCSIVSKSASKASITSSDYENFMRAETAFSWSIVKLRDELHSLLLSFDHLTGTLNRQEFLRILDQEYARFVRLGEPCCLVLLDIDHFKNINDQYGHAIGDKVLFSVTSYLIDHLRPYDSLCRYGGEEFLICLPNTTLESSYAIVERIRLDLSRQEICIPEGGCVKMTASFGIASMSVVSDLDETIKQADKALYQAKAGGRNKIEVWKGNARQETR